MRGAPLAFKSPASAPNGKLLRRRSTNSGDRAMFPFAKINLAICALRIRRQALYKATLMRPVTIRLAAHTLSRLSQALRRSLSPAQR
jgi:hypothetical protein